jgi:hypothetical protein
MGTSTGARRYEESTNVGMKAFSYVVNTLLVVYSHPKARAWLVSSGMLIQGFRRIEDVLFMYWYIPLLSHPKAHLRAITTGLSFRPLRPPFPPANFMVLLVDSLRKVSQMPPPHPLDPILLHKRIHLSMGKEDHMI